MTILFRGLPPASRTMIGRVVSVLAATLVAGVFPLPAQVQPSARRAARPAVGTPIGQSRGEWQLEPDAAVDLWYHGLAVIGVERPGVLPLYNAAYARRIREEKEELGIYPTRLDEVGADLRRAIQNDETLSLLHFVPLYFYGADPVEMLHALGAIADGRASDVWRMEGPLRFGALVMTQALQTGTQRRLVRRLTEALETEYTAFFRGFWERRSNDTREQLAELERRWTQGLALDLGDFLVRVGLGSGVLIPSPPLGPEGRLYAGEILEGRPLLLVVWMPPDGSVDAPLYGAVREVAFTVVDRVVDPRRYDSSELDDVRARAAVRCGAILLEFYSPADLTGYRRAFLEAAGGQWTGRRTAAAFEQMYPLDPDFLSMLQREIRRR